MVARRSWLLSRRQCRSAHHLCGEGIHRPVRLLRSKGVSSTSRGSKTGRLAALSSSTDFTRGLLSSQSCSNNGACNANSRHLRHVRIKAGKSDCKNLFSAGCTGPALQMGPSKQILTSCSMSCLSAQGPHQQMDRLSYHALHALLWTH